MLLGFASLDLVADLQFGAFAFNLYVLVLVNWTQVPMNYLI